MRTKSKQSLLDNRMSEMRNPTRETLKITSAHGMELRATEEGVFHFPMGCISNMDDVGHLCRVNSVWEEGRQSKVEQLLLRVGYKAPGHSLKSLMEEMKKGAPMAVGLSKAGYIIRIGLYIDPREEQVFLTR